MKKRFTEEQIIGFLREADAGLSSMAHRLTRGAKVKGEQPEQQHRSASLPE